MMTRSGFIELCTISKPHGVRGKLKGRTYLQGNVDLDRIGSVTLAKDGAQDREIKLENLSVTPKGLILKLHTVDTFEDAADLTGFKVLVKDEFLDKLEEGEYYWRDLIGSEVYDADGTRLGELKDVIERGEQDLMVVRNGKEEILVPAAEEIIKDIDVVAKKIIVELPEGLRDI